jgi:hypothetical protein
VVAEATFQDHVWSPNLSPLATLADLRVVQCRTDPATARRRIAERAAKRHAHADDALLDALDADDRYFVDFRRVAIDAPSIPVRGRGSSSPSDTNLWATWSSSIGISSPD